MKIRKFELNKDTGAVISDDGEFVHINDIRLLLMERKRMVNNLLNGCQIDDKDSNEMKQYNTKRKYSLESQLDMLEDIEDKIVLG